MKNSLQAHAREFTSSRTQALGLWSFFLYCIFGISTKNQAQQNDISLDSTEVTDLYQKIIGKTKCVGGLSPEAFYALLDSYATPQYTLSYYASPLNYTPSNNSYTPYQSSTQNKSDTIFIRDTITQTITKTDSFFVSQEMPTQNDVKVAQIALKKILQDQDLTSLIEEVVQDMSSEEVKAFRKEIQEKVQEMDNQLKQEQNRLLLAELEAKRLTDQLERAARKEARIERKEAWDTLSKSEKQELIKAKVAEIAQETGEALGVAGKAVGLSLAAVGAIVGLGVVAVGKGILQAASAVWNWINDHFYIRIDLSCAQQRKIKQNRLYLAKIHKNKPVVHYKGYCPQW